MELDSFMLNGLTGRKLIRCRGEALGHDRFVLRHGQCIVGMSLSVCHSIYLFLFSMQGTWVLTRRILIVMSFLSLSLFMPIPVSVSFTILSSSRWLVLNQIVFRPLSGSLNVSRCLDRTSVL